MYESNQEVFNTVADHLIRQGRRAVKFVPAELSFQGVRLQSFNERCRYHAPNGDKCAIGALIPDELYSPGIESQPVARVLCSRPPSYASVGWLQPLLPNIVGPGVSDMFLERLQQIHDCSMPTEWPRLLRECAESWRLQLPPCLAETAPSERALATVS